MQSQEAISDIMPQPSLPVELWVSIAKDHGLWKQEWCSLSLVSREFYNLFIPLVYEELNFQLNPVTTIDEDSPSTKFTASRPQERGLLELLDTSQRHRDYVRRIHILNSDYFYEKADPNDMEDSYSQFADPILSVIMECPNLQSMNICATPLNVKYIFRLASRSNSAISITLSDCTFTGEPQLDLQYTAASLECDTEDLSILYPIAFFGSLKFLHLCGTPINALTRAQMVAKTPSLTSLRHLSIPDLNEDMKKFFELAPNLTSLCIDERTLSLEIPYIGEWGNTLPNLQEFTGPSNLIHQFLPRRPVTSLSTWDLHEKMSSNMDLSAEESNFGSTRSISRLNWMWCLEIGRQLSYIVAKCPSVEHLEFSNVVGTWTQHELLRYINELKKMKHLRTLLLKYGESTKRPTDEDLAWERVQCETLQIGCPNLQSVHFPSSTSWNRESSEDTWKSFIEDRVFYHDCIPRESTGGEDDNEDDGDEGDGEEED